MGQHIEEARRLLGEIAYRLRGEVNALERQARRMGWPTTRGKTCTPNDYLVFLRELRETNPPDLTGVAIRADNRFAVEAGTIVVDAHAPFEEVFEYITH